MHISYFIQFEDGEGEYRKTLREAKLLFNNNNDSIRIEKHLLTNDCFERAYNGGGGFIEEVIIIKSK